MPTPGLYESESRVLKDFIKYLVKPGAELAVRAGMSLADALGEKNQDQERQQEINDIASQVGKSAGVLALWGITSNSYSSEREALFRHTAAAVAAETGIMPETMRDLGISRNPIVLQARDQLSGYTAIRFATDTAYFWMDGVKALARKMGANNQLTGESRDDNKNLLNASRKMLDSLTQSDVFKLAGSEVWGIKAVGQYAASYLHPNSTYFYIQKLEEKLHLGADVDFNHVFHVIQRHFMDTHGNARFNREEKEALRPIVQTLVHHINRDSGRFDTAELTYLVGMDKIQIHDGQGRISQSAVQNSLAHIEELASKGLDGLYQEKRLAILNRQADIPTNDNTAWKNIELTTMDTAYRFTSKLKALTDAMVGERVHRMQYDQHVIF